MTFAETLIIYLSLGAPVAVYHYQHLYKLNANAALIRSLAAFIFWPAVLVRIFANASSDPQRFVRTAADDDSDRSLQRVFEIAKREFDAAGRSGELASFREIVERYAGLTRAERAGDATLATAVEFYEAAGHPQPRLAAACSTRRAAEKLRGHARAAAAEMRDLFAVGDASAELIDSAAGLAAGLGDRVTADFLSTINDARTDSGPFALGRKVTRAA